MSEDRTTEPTRRGFLRGLLAAPFVVRAALIMPVKPNFLAFPRYVPGDLVACPTSHITKPGTFIGARVVHHIDSEMVYCWNNSFGASAAWEATPIKETSLFEGLPGNRVNNPSARHRLLQPTGRFGYHYPGDELLRRFA